MIVLLCYSCNTNNTKEQEYPNIIFVLADDLGYGDISVYNKEGKINTPNVDRLAADGIMFTDAHTSSSMCTPTRYGILTGRYNWRTRLKQGVLTGKSKPLIANDRTTVASLLKREGYNTAVIGKWHLGLGWALKDTTNFGGGGWVYKHYDNIDFSKPIKNTPNDLGFDYSYIIPASLSMPPYVYIKNGEITHIPDTITENTNKYTTWRKGPMVKDFVHADATPTFFKKSFKYINEMSKEDKPFFLYLALPSPRFPFLPTKEWIGKSGLNPYGDFVMMVDDYIGKLDNVIREAGVEDNTIVIFTSDNGCAPQADFDLLVEKGHNPSYIYKGHKFDIYEGGHRVPYIVRWPSKIEKGIVTDEVICTTDLLATSAEIVGYELMDDEGEDSYSLLPLFEQKNLENPLREATVHHSGYGNFAIRKGDWKLIMCQGSGGGEIFPNPIKFDESEPPFQLYNLKTDPGEKINLYLDNPDIVAELKTLLIKYIEEGRSTPGMRQKNDPIDFEWKQIDFVNR